MNCMLIIIVYIHPFRVSRICFFTSDVRSETKCEQKLLLIFIEKLIEIRLI